MNDHTASGVYVIKCTANGRQYIGSSWNIPMRLREHFKELRDSIHDNKALQADFDKFGVSSFTSEVLAYQGANRKYVEQNYIEKAQQAGVQLYNVRNAKVLTWELSKIGGVKRSKLKSHLRPKIEPEEAAARMRAAGQYASRKRQEAVLGRIREAVSAITLEGGELTNKGIARRCGVHARTVARYRNLGAI